MQPTPVDWTQTYSKEDKIPYGTYVVYNSLTDIFPGTTVKSFREPVYNVINDHEINNATYIIVGKRVNLSEYDLGKLLPFIQKGNDVLISSEIFNDTLSRRLKVEADINYDTQSDNIYFVNSNIDTNKKYSIPDNKYDAYFSELDTAHAISLVQNNFKQSTLIKYSFGKGNLYLNCTPKLFTNYFMLDPGGAEYTAKVLSYLKNKKTLIWDEYYMKGREGDESIMRVFFRSSSLKWAYYICLYSMVIFVLYEMKRRQRAIPVIEQVKNSSVDFAMVVGQVYYEQKDNMNIAQKKIVFFLEHLRTRYYLKTNALDDEFIERLSQKTGVEYSFVLEIVNYIKYIAVQQRINDLDLIKLNQLIEQFYKKST
jgi:hypothetical protein